tara:strand:- start:410 stop:1492 length:1083 start_codon:yes stop_codon:yes gene_type:complete
MPYGSIYKIPFPNGKHYLGLTERTLEKRKGEHKYYAKNGDTRRIYNALRKYDMVDTFELIEIDTAETLEELCEKEIGYIQMYNSFDKEYGYNMTLGGEGTNGYVFTEEDKQKMSESQKKYYENPEAREKARENTTKYYENPEAREKTSNGLKKYYKENPEAIQKNSESKKKYHKEHPEAGTDHSERLKKYYENPEAIQKNSEAQKKYHEENPEAKQKISEGLKKYYENSEARQKNSESKKKYHKEHPEAGKEHSERLKKLYRENPKVGQNIGAKIKQKISDSLKKYNKENPEAKKKMLDGKSLNKPFDVFKIDGIFIETFNYQFEAKEYLQKEYNKEKIDISAVLCGRQTSSKGFVFKYK